MLEGRNRQKMATNEKEKSALSPRQYTLCHKLIATMTKLYEFHFELLLYPPYSPDLSPSDYLLFTNLKRMLQGKRFDSNEVKSETEMYFEAKDKSFYKKGIELLEKNWNQCITLERDYVNE